MPAREGKDLAQERRRFSSSLVLLRKQNEEALTARGFFCRFTAGMHIPTKLIPS